MSLQHYVNSKLPLHPPHTLRVYNTGGCIACTAIISDRWVEKVLVLTSDSRTLIGTLLSCDQQTNLVLSQTIERIIRPPDDPEPSSEVPHGLYLIRGDNVAVVGLVEEELDDSIDWLQVRGAVVGGVKHS
ncbi:hypothetical protein QTJ16_004418 [Diplocarpon rosae]|uniref:LSM2-LSM8 complex subunit LSM8 n=1 Tax=Diplocarpon rosae TaxID=946125 RepID=A0AAD9SYW7_9HELO|nr:hypothetical protein QTJ16_004418 [Diplocarpon rosae]